MPMPPPLACCGESGEVGTVLVISAIVASVMRMRPATKLQTAVPCGNLDRPFTPISIMLPYSPVAQFKLHQWANP